MAETFSLSEFVIPGTFIRVRAEGLISVGGISTGNIGIVGTAEKGTGETHNVSDYETAKAIFVDQNPQAGMQAFMAGKIKLQGDMTKSMALQSGPPNPDLTAKIQAITE